MPVDTNSSEYLNFAEIKASASVRVVLVSLDLLDILKPKGEELVGRCMLGDEPHGKKDSFSFNTSNKKFQCFSCKTRGSILDFVAKHGKQGMTLRDSALYIQSVMRSAYALAGEEADDDALVSAIEQQQKKISSAPVGREQESPPAKPQVTTPSLETANLQNAVMSWSLASYRVQDGKLNPDDLIVVDVSTLEFLHQLTIPTDAVREKVGAYLHTVPTKALSKELSMRLGKKALRTPHLTSATLAKDYFVATLATRRREVFYVMLLDQQHKSILCKQLFVGTVNAASVYPREIVRLALKNDACAVMVAHNHPSDTLKPSEADRAITEKIKKALETVDIRLLDHIIVGGNNTLSFTEEGLL